jgi:hypothetical protein
MLKRLSISVWSLLLLLALPISVFADDNPNPFTKLKTKMKFNWGVLDNTDWVFNLVMIVISLATIVLLVLTIWDIIRFLFKVRKGKADMKDKKFWIECGVIVFILFLFFSGLFFTILENLYNYITAQNIGKVTTGTTTTTP